MFLICFSKDSHIISYSSDTWHTEENCIKFLLEHILSYDGTHWKSCLLEPFNVQSHGHQFSWIWVQFHHPVTLFEISNGELGPYHGIFQVFPQYPLYSMVLTPRLHSGPLDLGRFTVSSLMNGQLCWNPLEPSFPQSQSCWPILSPPWLAPKFLTIPSS